MAVDVIGLITADHRDIEALFERIRETPENRPALVAELAAKFVAHSRAEEEKVYPVLAKKDPSEKKEVHHGAEEHHEAEEILSRLIAADPDGPDFDGPFQELVGAITHHVEEEESEVLPALAKALPPRRLAEMGREFSERKARELSGPTRPAGRSKEELLQEAEKEGVQGRSQMTKEQLITAIKEKKSAA
ncbi:hemerythrin domain-containing protein [Microtetraspora niveoalba]|uniref:hemerythrin domain-containing protein n=1 Tax=Microtetraspora niveoalba TaxID=46175 RepID=UPI0008310D10|nr:hemerythrin domain-containing protein [Microtetraspora niveoalba]